MHKLLTTRSLVLVGGLVLGGALFLPAPVSADGALRSKIGQMLMLGFQGTHANSPRVKTLAKQVAQGQVGSVVMLGYNFKSKGAIKGLTHTFRKAAGGKKIFLAVDMEGGFVQRLGPKLGYPKVPSAKATARSLSPAAAAKSHFRRLASITRNAGFNMNLAPVIDLELNRANPVISKWQRSYGADPKKVAAYGRAFVKAHRAQGVMAVLKHFPGHGSSRSDSHDGFVDISKTWKASELLPFKSLIASGDAPAIMPGHLVNRKLAGNGAPASLSRSIISGLLRSKMGYRGLVISDDLQMNAIAKNYSYRSALINAVNAGVDILMISNSRRPDPNLPSKTITIIENAVKAGKISKGTINAAYGRIMRAKRRVR